VNDRKLFGSIDFRLDRTQLLASAPDMLTEVPLRFDDFQQETCSVK